ncbi:MAG: hypothetical protein JKY54_07060 [Flavobacteriales bacterium]|nr:hypothetical protein [Flavobacteriales bacterium]
MKIVFSIIFILSITLGFAQTHLTDSTSGCQYWLPWNCDVCTLNWTGSCLDSLPEGSGVLTVHYGTEQILKYEGEMKNGQFDGIGNYSDAQNKLNGYFKNGNFINLDKALVQNLEINPISNSDSTNIYVGDGTSSELFYYAILPKERIEGVLILFPSTWESVESVINNNITLAKLAYAKNLLLIVPSINYNLCLDENSMSFLNKAFKHMIERYAPPIDKIVLGGFSLGGMNAIRYTEMAYNTKITTLFKPAAVYGVDPPLDLDRLYRSFERTIEKNFSKPAMREAEDYLNKINLQFGGNPTDFPEDFVKYSMFSKSEKDGGNAKDLINVPIRIYCDPDIDWQLKNRRMDLYDMNAIDQTAMISYLLLSGNTKAEFISVIGKGYRMDGRRHPHSWSLVDPEDCINWIFKTIE